MERIVSTALVRRLVGSCRPRSSTTAAASRLDFQQFMAYSSGPSGDSNTNGDASTTRVAADPDTHQDFQPASEVSPMSYQDRVAMDIKEHPVLIYMKGTPDSPRCGFSAMVVHVFQLYRVPVTSRDILSDFELKESVKAHTHWSIFPQVFVNGKFVGGYDIILSMHMNFELEDLLAGVAKEGKRSSAS